MEIKRALWELMPILIVAFVIMSIACLSYFLSLMGLYIKISGALSILPGLIASIIWVCIIDNISRKQLQSAIMDKNIFPLLLLIAAIMIFKGIMIESLAVLYIRNEMMAYNIPVLLVIMIIPFISGFITGIAIGFVGTSFPIIIPMFQADNLFHYLSFAALSYTFGYIGMMLSPVHLCFIVSKDYFKAHLLKCYRHLILPSLTVMFLSVLFFLISKTL